MMQKYMSLLMCCSSQGRDFLSEFPFFTSFVALVKERFGLWLFFYYLYVTTSLSQSLSVDRPQARVNWACFGGKVLTNTPGCRRPSRIREWCGSDIYDSHC
jgi:hypothetical protein